MTFRPLLLVLTTVPLLALGFGCQQKTDIPAAEADLAPTTVFSDLKLEFLSREGCVNTPKLYASLEAAVATGLGFKVDFQRIDQGTLAADDVRRGFPTPTILFRGEDIYGLDAPKPPYPPPT